MLRALFIAVLGLGAAPATAQPVDWSEAITLTIEIGDHRISPKRLILYEGQPYRLYFVNRSPRTHNFFAPRFFRAATIAPGENAVIDGEVELREGQSASVYLTPPAGAFEYDARCTHLAHDAFGGRAHIEVRPMPVASASGAQ